MKELPRMRSYRIAILLSAWWLNSMVELCLRLDLHVPVQEIERPEAMNQALNTENTENKLFSFFSSLW